MRVAAFSLLALTISCATAPHSAPVPAPVAMATQASQTSPAPPLPPPCSKVDFWVFYLDSAGSNFLFRGGMPIVNGQIAYQELIGTKFPDAAGRAGKTLPPPPYFIIDVSLVQVANPGNDQQDLPIEYNYWTANPTLGQFVYWETDGSQIDPNDPYFQNKQPFRNALVKSVPAWLPDYLDPRVDQLHAWLQNGIPGINVPIMIYVHCIGGCDRTGELSGAYALKYLKMNWTDVNNMNYGDCYNHCVQFGCNNFHAARWYCYWLDSTQGGNLQCDATTTPPCH